jgi:lipoprotein LprG
VVSLRTWSIVVVVVVAVTAAGTLGACSSPSGEGDTDDRSVDQLLADAAVAMAEVESAAFTIEQSGEAIFIDDANQLAFRSADGRFARPASAEALIAVEALGFRTEIGAVAIDGDVWLTDPLSGAWAEAPASFTFDPSTLFDPEVGLPALLAESAATAERVDDGAGEDPAGGDDRHHLRTTVAAERVSVLTGGLVTERTDVDLWIDPLTSRLTEVRFDLPVDGGVSSWEMTLSDYDAEVVIDPPQLGTTG